MNKALEPAVRRALAKFVIALGNKLEGSIDESVEVYLTAVSDLEHFDIDGAVPRIIRGEKFFPKPAVLRAYALEERIARTVMVRPLVYTGEDIQCSACGATKLWGREVTNARGTFFRYEVLHASHCHLRRADQGMLTITMGAA